MLVLIVRTYLKRFRHEYATISRFLFGKFLGALTHESGTGVRTGISNPELVSYTVSRYGLYPQSRSRHTSEPHPCTRQTRNIIAQTLIQ